MGIDNLKSFFLQRLQTFFSLIAFSDVVQIYKYHLVILKHSTERRANPLILRLPNKLSTPTEKNHNYVIRARVVRIIY